MSFVRDLDKLIDYNWSDEMTDFMNQHEISNHDEAVTKAEGDNDHIFGCLVRLSKEIER